MSDIRDCNDCQYEPGDCLFCSDITKNMFKPKTVAADTEALSARYLSVDDFEAVDWEVRGRT